MDRSSASSALAMPPPSSSEHHALALYDPPPHRRRPELAHARRMRWLIGVGLALVWTAAICFIA